jgi:Holliday junction resolvasome RuvABC ATP-dependent DNA helicase subunit
MLEGKLYTKRGAETVPDVTLIAATTDAGKLPETLLSRFMVQPTIVPYTPAEAAAIAQNLADRMGVRLSAPGHAERIAQAADSNPRSMRRILTAVRDLQHAYGEGSHLERAFEYAGVSEDGLTQIARDMLLVLLTNPDYTASIEYINATLGEPGPLKHHEKQLLQRGLVTITGRGRSLTTSGLTRAKAEFAATLKRGA